MSSSSPLFGWKTDVPPSGGDGLRSGHHFLYAPGVKDGHHPDEGDGYDQTEQAQGGGGEGVSLKQFQGGAAIDDDPYRPDGLSGKIF
jgi:hypothetical protein